MEVSSQLTPRPLYPRGRVPGKHWVGGCVGSRAGLEPVAKGKNFHHCPCSELNPAVQSLRSILILSLHQRLGFPNGLFPSGFAIIVTPRPTPNLEDHPLSAVRNNAFHYPHTWRPSPLSWIRITALIRTRMASLPLLRQEFLVSLI
jgi:hypothetical protein